MITQPIVAICREYAQLECLARESQALDPRYPQTFRAAARFLYDHAPYDALAHLDTIKKVFEVDPDIQDVGLVLMRASVIPADTTPTPGPWHNPDWMK